MAQHVGQLVNIDIYYFIFYIEIFFEALEKKVYNSFLGPKSDMPMIYIDDCILATV